MPLQEVFQGKVTGFEAKIILNAEGIVFFLLNPHRRRCYQARIPYVLQGKSKQIQDIFTNLDEFYLYVTQFSQDKDRISISQTGTIRVAFFEKKTKKMNPPVVYIQTEILMTGMQIKNEVKLQHQISDVKRDNLHLQNKINQLIKINENNQAQIEKLRTFMNKKVTNQRDSSASSSSSESLSKDKHKKKTKKKKYSVISDSKSGIVQLKTAVKQLSKDIEGINGMFEGPKTKNSKIRPKNNQTVQNAKLSNESFIFGQKMTITVDQNNQFLKKNYSVQGNLITKINGYGRYQLLSKEVIPPFGKHYFVMYIEKISYKIFSLGIVSQKRRNFQNSHLSVDLISYFAKTGAIWQFGDCRCGGPQIPNNVEIRIVVDMDKFTVTWFMDKKQIATTEIGEHLRAERLVAYLQFNYQGDKIYWNERTLPPLL